MPYRVEFAESVKAHLEALTADQRATVLAAVETQLTSEPLTETRNRKPLRPNPVAPWELRVSKMRVFYDVSEGPPQTVRVLAVGLKDRNILRIGGGGIYLWEKSNCRQHPGPWVCKRRGCATRAVLLPRGRKWWGGVG